MKSLISVQSKFPELFSSGIRKKTITRSLAAPPCSFYSHENSYSETITLHKSLLVEEGCHLCLFLKYHSHDFSYHTSVLPSCSPHAQNHADFVPVFYVQCDAHESHSDMSQQFILLYYWLMSIIQLHHCLCSMDM